MRVRSLNCGTMRPVGGALVAHVLLVETGEGLVLVDTGFGLADIAAPGSRLGPSRHVIRPVLDPEETSARQVERLGYDRAEVRHIVLTHFDLDHIGGLADFPDAAVHVTTAELDGAVRRPSLTERQRFRPAQWAHGPRFVEHSPAGEPWRGFAAAQPLAEVDPGIVLIALPGHTRGHLAVAVEAGGRWILHAGDAFYTEGTIDGSGSTPVQLRLMERLMAFDARQVRDNHARLSELWREADDDLLIVSAHDPELLRRAQAVQPP